MIQSVHVSSSPTVMKKQYVWNTTPALLQIEFMHNG